MSAKAGPLTACSNIIATNCGAWKLSNLVGIIFLAKVSAMLVSHEFHAANIQFEASLRTSSCSVACAKSFGTSVIPKVPPAEWDEAQRGIETGGLADADASTNSKQSPRPIFSSAATPG